jgi:hypothetical protein
MLSFGVGASVCVLAPALAQAPAINVKAGLWEMASDRTSEGLPKAQAVPQLPPEVLAGMTPAQRRQIEGAMQAAQGQGAGA